MFRVSTTTIIISSQNYLQQPVRIIILVQLLASKVAKLMNNTEGCSYSFVYSRCVSRQNLVDNTAAQHPKVQQFKSRWFQDQ